MSLRRITLLAIAALASAAPTAAVTLTVTPDKPTYARGETVTLTVVGDAQLASSNAIFGRLEMSASRTRGLSASQTPHTSNLGTVSWGPGPLRVGFHRVEAFNQIAGDFHTPDQQQVATVTLCAGWPGVVDVSWTEHSPYDPFGLTFFDISAPPGTSFEILPDPGGPGGPLPTCLPEPSGAAMWLAGVGALWALRPRSRSPLRPRSRSR